MVNTSSPLARMTGVVTRSGAVRVIECCSARPTIACSAANRSLVLTKRRSRVWRAASARRFQRVHVARLVCSVRTVAAPYASSVSGLRSAAARGRSPAALSDRWMAATASCPMAWSARFRHCAMSTARGWAWCLEGRFMRVACCRRAYISRRSCGRIWSSRSSRSALRLASICAVLAENSRISSSGIASISNAGLRREPRSRSSQFTPRRRVRWSARSTLWISDIATAARYSTRPSRVRQAPSGPWTRFATTT